MKNILLITMYVILVFSLSLAFAVRVKPRVIACTDGEVDDRSTMIRFLMYSSDFDVAGVVQTNSKFQKSGHSKEQWFEKELGEYGKLLSQLRKHHPDFPTAEYLKSVMTVGNENINDLYVEPAKMATKNTAGEKFIIKTLLDDDPRPVHIGCWGGVNTPASALWRLKYSGEYTDAQFKKAVSKIRLYCIWYQDGGGQWVEDNIKEAVIYEAYRWDNVWDYGSTSGNTNPDDVKKYMTADWLNTNVKKDHGALGAMTPQSYISEGDTPSWLPMIENGLESHVDYSYGGWGGRGIYDLPDTKPNHLSDDKIDDDGNKNKMFWRWVIAAQNDFAARMDWCVKDFSQANHAPVAMINGTTYNDNSFVAIDATPGSTVNLDATGSTDPDKNSLSFNWWVYKEVGSYGKTATITDPTKATVSMTIPSDALNKTIHVILEVKDNGSPSLIGYRRAIISVKSTVAVSNRPDAEIEMKTITVHKSVANGLTMLTVPLQTGADSKISLYNISGKTIPFTMTSSGTERTIAYKANGIVFLKIANNDKMFVYKYVQ